MNSCKCAPPRASGGSRWRVAMHALAAVLIGPPLLSLLSCTKAPEDPQTDLVRSLEGADVDGYEFEMREDASRKVASLTNAAVNDLIYLDDDDASVVLRYTRVTDKQANNASVYRTAVRRDGSVLALRVTDTATDEVLLEEAFPVASSPVAAEAAGPTFDNLNECLKEFECSERGALQCAANSTCKDQFANLECCLNDGQCYSVHLIIKPTTRRCTLQELIPHIEGLVLTR